MEGGGQPVLSFEQCFILFCSFPLLFAFVVGGPGFELCVFVAGWRHALRSEWPFIIIIIITANLLLLLLQDLGERSEVLFLRPLPAEAQEADRLFKMLQREAQWEQRMVKVLGKSYPQVQYRSPLVWHRAYHSRVVYHHHHHQ